jgi:7-cyano-7-deazaguanine synthase
LLSGGFDSVAALHLAKSRYAEVRAIGFQYGQPHADAELTVAGRIARERNVEFVTPALADAVPRGVGFMGGPCDHEAGPGINHAFVPGRNLIFATIAAAYACRWWTVGPIAIVMGATKDDADGFPDCRKQVLATLGTIIKEGTERQIWIDAPWVDKSKAGVLVELEKLPHAGHAEVAIADVQRSWSCYRGGDAPCGTCTACVVRARAFAISGVTDLSARLPMHGGDAHREMRLRDG